MAGPNKIRIFSLVLTGLLYGSAALASNEGGHGEEITFIGDWLPRLVNFAIIAGVLVYFMRKPAGDFFKSRSAEIARSMQESREAREKAQAALAEMERKMKELEAETGRMVTEATSRAEQDKQTLISEGKKVVEEINSQVKSNIEVELQKAKAALSIEAALLSIDLAENRIKDKIDKQDHDKIIKDYISRVGGRG